MPRPAWLNTAQRIERQERAMTPGGVELREAQYVAAGGNASLVLLLRDYAVRTEDKPDLQWLVQMGPDTPAQRITIPGDALPTHLATSSSHQDWGTVMFPPVPAPVSVSSAKEPRELADKTGKPLEKQADAKPETDSEAVRHARGYQLRSAGFAVATPSSAGAVQGGSADTAPARGRVAVAQLSPLVLGDGLCPLGFSGDKLLYCRTLTGTSLAGGLVIPKVDWAAQAEYLPLDGSEVTLTSDPAFVVNPDGSAAAGLAPYLLEGMEPGWALYAWQKKGSAASRALVSLKAPVSGFAAWTTQLSWLDPQWLAVFSLMPPAADDADAPPTLELLTVNASTGAAQLVANHLPVGSALSAADGVVFYAVPLAGSDGRQRWEVWASAADGLDQRQVYATAQAVTVTIADSFAGRLLVNRQFFDASGADAQLRNQLVEISPAPLAPWKAEADALDSPLGPPAIDLEIKPPAKPAAPLTEGDSFIPDEAQGGSKYDRRGDNGDGSGEGNDGPPKLPPLPGL
jgi:hypothetical protein